MLWSALAYLPIPASPRPAPARPAPRRRHHNPFSRSSRFWPRAHEKPRQGVKNWRPQIAPSLSTKTHDNPPGITPVAAEAVVGCSVAAKGAGGTFDLGVSGSQYTLRAPTIAGFEGASGTLSPSTRLMRGIEFENSASVADAARLFGPGNSARHLALRAFDDAGNLLPGRTVIDLAGSRGSNLLFREYKLDQWVNLTARQNQHFPFLARNGGVIVGDNGLPLGLPAGTRLPATTVERVNGPSILNGGWWAGR